jgi:hypothetical protein
MSGAGYTFDGYEEFMRQLRASAPNIRFTGSSQNTQRKCTSQSTAVLRGVSAIDNSVLPNVSDIQSLLEAGEYAAVRLELTVNWSPSASDAVQRAEALLRGCQTQAGKMDSVKSEPLIDDWVPGMFVGETGEVPEFVSRGRAIAGGIFWSGVLHAYQVDSIPVLHGVVEKTEAELTGSVSCVDLHMSCRQRK